MEQASMATQLMFYEAAVPVSSQRHTGLSVKAGDEYGFARKANSAPLTTVEVRQAAAEYVVVFAGQGDEVMPVALLGVLPERNLFIKEDGTWDGAYVPAFVRRYPFVFASTADGSTFTLCVDEAFSGCNREGRGEQLFDAAGERTQYLETVLNFVKEYQVQHQRTQAFCKHLGDLGLLEPMQAQFTLADGTSRNLTGFMAVNRTRLKALDRETLADLALSDELELIYLHLNSLQHFNGLLKRVGAEPDARAAADDLPPEGRAGLDSPARTH
jgi:hypothetical protein